MPLLNKIFVYIQAQRMGVRIDASTQNYRKPSLAVANDEII